MKVYKITDRLPIRIHDIEVKLSPLTLDQKTEIRSCTRMQSGVEISNEDRMAFLSIKYSVKEMVGATNTDGSPYELRFDGDTLSDECVEELLNSQYEGELAISSYSMLRGVPKEIINPLTGLQLQGVEIIEGKTKPHKKTK